MPCKCFDIPPGLTSTLIIENLAACKCKCSARYTVSENGMKFEITGLSDDRAALTKLEKIKVDGCLLKDSSIKKCDFLFIYNDKKFLFVELKGKNIEEAVKQLTSTIRLFMGEGVLQQKEVRAFIVSKRHPSFDGTFRKLHTAFMQEFKIYNPKLHHKNMILRYNPVSEEIK